MMDMAAPMSTVTARDIATRILADVNEIPTTAGAERIAAELMKRGTYIRPEYLLSVWMDLWKGGERDD